MRVLITGGTGALGQALIRRLILDPTVERLICFSRSESRQADVRVSLPDHPALRWALGDVRDVDRLEQAMLGCEAVIHAAANKRVDAGAYSPGEMLLTNVLGTINVIKASLRAGVRRVLFISSDKAPNAANIYGASKYLAEHLVIDANSYAVPRGLIGACTRWGNVLASTGSVVCLWREAIRRGERLRVTDPDMTRFWLTLDQAAAFALDALAIMRGGELLIPVLPAMRLGDLAEALAPGQSWIITGLRPGGEKQHEVLLTEEEGTRTVAVGTETWVVNPAIHSWRADPPWTGEPWPAGALYRSDLVPRLTVDQMRAMLKEVP